MSTISYQLVMQAIDEALANPEFRASIARAILLKIADVLPDEGEEPAASVVSTGIDLYSAHALACRFQSQLGRRPASDEDIYTLTAHFEDALREMSGQYIYDALRVRGRSAEKLWKFLDRIRAEIKETALKKNDYYEHLKAKTANLIAERAQ